MNSVKALLRLEFKAKFGSVNLKDIKGMLKLSAVLLFSLLIYAVYIYGARSFFLSFYIYDMQYIFLVLFISLIEIVLFFGGVSSMVKSLFFSGDNEILLRFPVKGSEVFVSKILLVLIIQSVTTLILMLPVFILYGVISREGAGFYLIMPVILIFSILLPFLFANILAIPFMFVKSFLKDKYTLLLFIFISFVAGGFAAYMASVQGLLSFMDEEALNFFSNKFMVILNAVTNYAFPFKQFANIMTGRDVLASLGLLLLLLSGVAALAYFIVKKMYLNTMLKNIEAEGSCFEKNTKNKPRRHFNALIRREFLEIFRSSNYSFQYLAMAFGAPIMVYFCNRLAVFVGQTNVGGGILPALTMLVMLIFISLIVSFSATSVSREGDNFYITKIAPVRYRVQVAVKLTLYLLVAFASIIVSFGILILLKYLNIETGLIMFGSCSLIALGETCMSIKLDINHPSFAVEGDGELTAGTLPAFISMFSGLIIAISVGVFGMVMSYFWALKTTLLIILAFSGAVAALSMFWLIFKLHKHYDNIMQR
jgi:ABC-2 type transport system permease protein